MPPIGKLLSRLQGLVWGDGVKDSSVYVDDHALYVDVVGQGIPRPAFVLRGLNAVTNAPTELFRVDKNGATAYTGGVSVTGGLSVAGGLTTDGLTDTGPATISGSLSANGGATVNPQLALPTTGPTGGVLMGGDALLYRSSANVLATGSGDGLSVAQGLSVVAGGETVTGGLTVDGVDVGDAAATARANLLVNPGFEVFQRGGTVSGVNQYAHDRWQNLVGVTDTLVITDETSIVDTGSGHSLKAVYTRSAGQTYIDQKLEHYLQLRGRTLTFAIRVRKGVANSVRPYIQDSGTKTFGATSATTGSFTTMTVTLAIGAGSTGVTVGVECSISDTLYLDNAVLVQGTTAPTFVPLGPEEDLSRCQRYYQEVGGLDTSELVAPGFAFAVTNALFELRFPVEMALAPTATISAAGDFAVFRTDGSLQVCTALTASALTRRNCRLNATVGSGLGGGSGTILVANATANARIRFEANP